LETDNTSRRSVATPDQARCPHCQAVLSTYQGDRRFTIIDAMILVAASALAFMPDSPASRRDLRAQRSSPSRFRPLACSPWFGWPGEGWPRV